VNGSPQDGESKKGGRQKGFFWATRREKRGGKKGGQQKGYFGPRGRKSEEGKGEVPFWHPSVEAGQKLGAAIEPLADWGSVLVGREQGEASRPLQRSKGGESNGDLSRWTGRSDTDRGLERMLQGRGTPFLADPKRVKAAMEGWGRAGEKASQSSAKSPRKRRPFHQDTLLRNK
jgi:hypothetical protein